MLCLLSKGLTKKQKDQVGYLKAAINCDENTAINLLKQTNWDVDKACDIHFSNPKNQEKAKPVASKKQEEIFEKYKGRMYSLLSLYI